MMQTRLDKFDNSWFHIGASKFKWVLWLLVDYFVFSNYFLPFSEPKRIILKLFGAKIGKNVILKPGLHIKYPWNLEIGDYSWIGENVWIDNLVKVSIGSHCCISQGAYLLTGNHNFKKETFDLIVKPINLKTGCWIGAKSVVCPGIICEQYSILTVGSVLTENMQEYSIYQGNPAILKKKREFL